MSSLETGRFCGICKKIFCCAQCRKQHEKNKHPARQLNCPLCTSQKLPLQNFEDAALLCHIVIHHLPLYCCLCGEIFKQSKDLEAFGACKWWQSRRRHSLIAEPKSLLETPPSQPDTKRSEESLDREYNGKFVTLTSPPELYRNTSTPMVVGQKTNFDFKTPNVPNFSLKTPTTNSAASTKGRAGFQTSTESKDGNSGSNFVSFSTSSSRHEETPFRSLPLNRASKDDNSSRNNSGRKLDIMKEEGCGNETNATRYTTDNHCIEDMELTGVEGEVLPDSQSLDMLCEKLEKRSDSIKKVRFSDQFECQSEPSTTGVFNMTENEEYFEARESLSGMADPMENSQTRISQENQKNAEKENRSPDGVNVVLNQQATGASRVVMMVVMENNSALTTSDLTPLIDSGLKKLERVTSSASYPSITNLSDRNSPRNSPSCSGSSMTSMDSYYSVSSYECYSTASSMSSSSYREPSSPVENKDSAGGGGIFSAVAHAVRSVMKNFSGAGPSRNIAREQVSPRQDVIANTSSADSSSTSMTNLTTSLVRRPGKRPRDASEPTASSSRHVDFVAPQVEARSPVAKRHRGWYRIKGREPIARMRNKSVTSPRGISSETQVFSQGSLSVGDTVLPLPVRAHQSTQTE